MTCVPHVVVTKMYKNALKLYIEREMLMVTMTVETVIWCFLLPTATTTTRYT